MVDAIRLKAARGVEYRSGTLTSRLETANVPRLLRPLVPECAGREQEQLANGRIVRARHVDGGLRLSLEQRRGHLGLQRRLR
jgi:hypothetical protein